MRFLIVGLGSIGERIRAQPAWPSATPTSAWFAGSGDHRAPVSDARFETFSDLDEAMRTKPKAVIVAKPDVAPRASGARRCARGRARADGDSAGVVAGSSRRTPR